MEIMVADTSVLIDLERGALIEKCFDLPYRFTVPDLLYRNELAGRDYGPGLGERLLALGLKVEELDGDEVSEALGYRQRRPALSFTDSFALALAAGRHWTLLTGDRVMREFAASLDVVCHGVLWLIDRIFEAGIASQNDLVSGLQAIRDHPRCRLPRAEIESRMVRYSLEDEE